MKYIKSTSQKIWKIGGKVIPACVTSNNDHLALAEEDFAKFQKNPIFNSLVTANQILVQDTLPEGPDSGNGSHVDVSEYKAEITRLKEELAAKGNTESVNLEEVKAQAQEEIRAEAVKELQEKQDALAKSEAALAAAQEEIKKLKKANK